MAKKYIKAKVYRLRRIVAALLVLGGFGGIIAANPAAYKDANEVESVNSAEIAKKDTQETADSTLAVDVLETLAVKDKNTSEKYYRKLFYDNWGRTSSGCTTREAILARDLTDVVMKDCKVQSGTLADPYTGQTINFVRGQETSSAVQIDHVVALSNAWATGAYALSEEERYDVSQDPLNLLAVDGPANQQKSDQDASDWLPSNKAFQCQYVARQISVKYKYHLWVTQREKAAMQTVLKTCPEEKTVGIENLINTKS